MSKEYRTMHTIVELPYDIAYGATYTRFFDGLKEEKILGTKCSKCNRVLIPARSFCPRCFADLDEWVEVDQIGTVETWCYVNYSFYGMAKKPPYITAMIRLEGADVGFIHVIGGFEMSDIEKVREKIKIGTKVKAKWNKEKNGEILDIEYFEPVE